MFYRRRRFLVVVLWLLLPSSVTAAAGRQPLHDYVARSWTSDDGLPQSSVTSIAQTRDGLLWLGTQEGLARFDGHTFEVLTRANTAGIPHDTVTALFVDRSGDLWVGFFGGLARHRNGAFESFTAKDGLANDVVNSIFQSRDGAMWISTYQGLARFDGRRFTMLTTREGLPHDFVSAVMEGRDGSMWVATRGGGVAVVKGGKVVQRFSTQTGLTHDVVTSLALQPGTDILWAGTRSGLNRISGGRIEKFKPDEYILSTFVDRSGDLWLGTGGKGVLRFDGTTFESYTAADGLSGDTILSVFEDREKTIWVGTNATGLNRLVHGKVRSHSALRTLDSSVNAILEGQDGTVWIASGRPGEPGGLQQLHNGTARLLGKSDGLNSDSILSLAKGNDGTIYAGTTAGVAAIKKDGTVTRYNAANGLTNEVVLSLLEDRAGRLWVGTMGGGLHLREGERFVRPANEALETAVISAIHHDPRGRLWVGTLGKGIFRLENDVWRQLTAADGLSQQSVASLYQDERGVLWIGTVGGGIARFAEERFHTFTTKNGLPNDTAYGIVEENGNLWVSFNKGIYRIVRSELEATVTNPRAAVHSEIFAKPDGLRAGETNGGSQPSASRLSDGTLWFATPKGVAIIDPAHLQKNEVVPIVAINEAVRGEERFPGNASVRLSPGKSDVEFHYAARTFVAPEKTRYFYRLEGYDDTWVPAQGRRVAYYTNLPPGSYRFQVAAVNGDGVRGESTILPVTLEPRFHQTRSFIALSVIAAALVIWSLYRLRVRQLRARFESILEERTRIARDLHDTLAQGLVGIALHLDAADELIDDDRSNARASILRARELATSSIAEARRSVQNLRSESLERNDLAAALRKSAERLTSGTSIGATVHCQGTVRQLPEEVETHLLRIGQEALTNAVRHAAPRSVEIELRYAVETVSLTIRDDGQGFDPALKPEGHYGLVGIRERADAIGAEVKIASTPGRGTTISVIVPIAHSRQMERRSGEN